VAGRIEDDHVLDMLVQSRRHSKAAKKCFRQLLKGLQPVPRVVITDPLKRYGAAKREMLPGVEHRQSCSLHKRCENLRRPMRQRERRLHRFKSAAQAQRLLSALSPLFTHVRPRRHLLLASESHNEMRQRFESGAEITVYEAGGLRAGSVGIEPQRRLLLSSDEISLNKLTKPKLTVNEEKTTICRVTDERFDFSGDTFGKYYSYRTGRPYIGTCPSKGKRQRLCRDISRLTGREWTWLDEKTQVARLNRMMVGWANYFCLCRDRQAYRNVNYRRSEKDSWFWAMNILEILGSQRHEPRNII